MRNFQYFIFALLITSSSFSYSEYLPEEKPVGENYSAQKFLEKNLPLIINGIGDKYGGMWLEYENGASYTVLALTESVDLDEKIMKMANIKTVYVKNSFNKLNDIQRKLWMK